MGSLPSFLQEQAYLYRLEKAKARTRERQEQALHSSLSKARSTLLDFTLYTKPDYEVNWHHRLIASHLDRFVAGEIKRLMIFLHPRSGKSEQVSRRLPAYIFGRNPDANIIAAAYSSDLAERMNRDVQRIMDGPEYHTLFPDTQLYGSNVRTTSQGTWLRNSDIFEIVGRRGVYRGAGVGGGIMGMGFHYGIIDDPYKDHEEANSPTVREARWEWFWSSFYTRQAKNAGILLTMTRWHEDDLAGRLLKLAKSDPNAEQWVVLSIPAIAEEPGPDIPPRHPDDPRKPGEAMWPSHFPLSFLSTMEASNNYQFNALYQQRPRAREGQTFKRPWFKIENAAPTKFKAIVRYWDKAGTAGGNGAATAGVLMALDYDNLPWVLDSVTGHWDAGDREKTIKQTAELDALRFRSRRAFKIWVEQEPGSGGKESAAATIRNLAGYIVEADRPTGDKDTRLDPLASQAKANGIRLLRGDWNEHYIEEMTSIPYGARRDQGDASSGAFNKLSIPVGVGFA